MEEEFSGANYPAAAIAKAKRSKRLRPPPSSSTSSTSGGGEIISPYSLVSSSTNEEDEDMANCLILLAHGAGGRSSPAGGGHVQLRTSEISDGSYECKSCSRSFLSFQALGGHRNFHKKPKSPLSAPPPLPPSPEKFGAVVGSRLMKNRSKIHECSLCGSKFGSGQALGGHMRRHRSETTVAAKKDSPEKKTGAVLELDLNLPAPPAEDRRDEESDQLSSNERRRLVFSAASLVDCRY
ncbi:zinc finger protein ZAT5 [Andrographis paniculata]|uniref:zinc finger protein ZAT5 n=1 Tax=Andrographis paniculata TaxID=175694 RepID=UPI0021E8C294|nr:zinc finger protein ZAT5 [Andrographis paniculata]